MQAHPARFAREGIKEKLLSELFFYPLRPPSAAADGALSENRGQKSDVRIIRSRLEKIKLPYISPADRRHAKFWQRATPSHVGGGRGWETEKSMSEANTL